MDNHAPPDALLPPLLSSNEAIKDVSTVYGCLEHFPAADSEYLPNFRDLDIVAKSMNVVHESDSDILVYNDNHARARSEVTFNLAGYIAAFDLPGRNILNRYVLKVSCKYSYTDLDSSYIHKPQTLKQRVMIVAPKSSGFEQSIDAVKCLGQYLEQFCTAGPTLRFQPRGILGLDGIETRCNLFTRYEENMRHPICSLPEYMDLSGRLAAQIRKHSYCYTTDNVVEYGESAKGLLYE